MGTWLNAACAAWVHARRTAPNSDATPGSCTRDTPGCARSAEEKTSTATAMASRHEGWRCVTNASRRASSRWGSKGAAMVLAHSNDRVYTSHSASTTSGDDLQGSALRADRVGHAADSTATAGCSTTAPLLLARLENSRNLTAAAINRTSAPSRSRQAATASAARAVMQCRGCPQSDGRLGWRPGHASVAQAAMRWGSGQPLAEVPAAC